MIQLLDEQYKVGLDNTDKHTISGINAIGNSFVAFQIYIDVDTEALLLFNDCYEQISDKKLPINRLYISSKTMRFDIYKVGTVNGYGDALIGDRFVLLNPQKATVLYCIAYTNSTVVDDRVDISFLYNEGQSNEHIEHMSINVYALDFCLPVSQNFHKKLDIWQHNTCIARYYGVDEYSDEHFEIIERFIKALAYLGQKSVSIIASHTPWDGQKRGGADKGFPADLYETQMSYIFKDKKGLKFDFSVIDRYIALCDKYGINEEIEVFGLCGAWTERTLIRAKNEYGYTYLSEEEINIYIRALYEHFKQKGYLLRTVICADEPNDMERMQRELQRIRNIAPDFRFKAALDHPEFADTFAGDLNVIVPSFFTACKRLDVIRKLNITKTWYICCGPNKPNTFISSPLAETRALAYLNEIFEFDGILRWAFTAWSREPYNESRVGAWECGDTYIVYPAKTACPTLSLRYFQIRRMMEDLQLLSMVDKNKFAGRIWHNTSPDKFEIDEWTVLGDLHTMSYQDFECVRYDMINDILQER